MGIRRLHEKLAIVKRAFRYIVARSRLRRALLEAQFRMWAQPPSAGAAKVEPKGKEAKAKGGKEAEKAAAKAAAELRRVQSRFDATVVSDPPALNALCTRVLQWTREELRVAYREWAVECAQLVRHTSPFCAPLLSPSAQPGLWRCRRALTRRACAACVCVGAAFAAVLRSRRSTLSTLPSRSQVAWVCLFIGRQAHHAH
jgi:hypothetical protein